MIRLAVILLVAGILAGLLGFGVIGDVPYEIAKFFFYVFLGVGLLILIAGWWTWKRLS